MTMTAAGADPLLDLASHFLPRLDAVQRQMAVDPTIPVEAERLVDELSEQLTTANAYLAFDPYLSNSLFVGLLAGEKGLRAENEDDRRRRLRLALEQVRHVLRDVLDERPAAEETDVLDVIRFVMDNSRVPQRDIAPLMGVHLRTLQRWISGEARPDGDDEARARMVARIFSHLRHVFTGPGAVRWFSRPHPGLDGEAPLTLLGDPVAAATLVHLAAGSRSTIAT